MVFVDKESGKSYIPVDETEHKEYASKNVAGTALGFGIGAAALWLLNGGLANNGLFGGRCNGGCNAADNALAVGEASLASQIQYVERKECADHVQFVNDMWRTSYNQQNQRFMDRQIINEEMFSIYKSTRDGFDMLAAKHNQDAFDLYKYSRDSKDELSNEIGALRTEIAVLKATRPYQDALIQCDIRRVAEHADFNLWRRTCRMISGEVVLPSTPTVTGYASYNPCSCTQASTAASTSPAA